MIASSRQAIRQAILALLLGSDDGPAPTAAGRNVYASWLPPGGIGPEPMAVLSTRHDRRERAMGGGVIRRRLEVEVVATARGDDADDQVDGLTAQVESVLTADPTLGGAVESITWQASEMTYGRDGVGDGDSARAEAWMTFEVVYASVPPEEDGPPLPSGVYASWAPDIGPPHEPDYVDLSDTALPDVTPNDGR